MSASQAGFVYDAPLARQAFGVLPGARSQSDA